MEGPAPRASRLQRDKETHPGALPRARCALTGARRPRASDAASRRRLRPSTSDRRRPGAGGGAGGRRVTWAGAHARWRRPAHLRGGELSDPAGTPRSRAPVRREARCACAWIV